MCRENAKYLEVRRERDGMTRELRAGLGSLSRYIE